MMRSSPFQIIRRFGAKGVSFDLFLISFLIRSLLRITHKAYRDD